MHKCILKFREHWQGAWTYVVHTQGRNEGGKGEQFSGRRITMGPPNHCGVPKSPKNVASTFFNTVNLLQKELRFEHGSAKLAFCPGRHPTLLHLHTRHLLYFQSVCCELWRYWKALYQVSFDHRGFAALQRLFFDKSRCSWTDRTVGDMYVVLG